MWHSNYSWEFSWYRCHRANHSGPKNCTKSASTQFYREHRVHRAAFIDRRIQKTNVLDVSLCSTVTARKKGTFLSQEVNHFLFLYHLGCTNQQPISSPPPIQPTIQPTISPPPIQPTISPPPIQSSIQLTTSPPPIQSTIQPTSSPPILPITEPPQQKRSKFCWYFQIAYKSWFNC